MKISHLKNKKLSMVDISKKSNTKREARAKSTILFRKKSYDFLRKEGSKKGEIFNVARTAGILAGKKTSELIPLCHNINLSSIEIKFDTNDNESKIDVFSIVKTKSNTGVEMEALTACLVAALTVYDMCKSIDKNIQIIDTRLILKSGGKSGVFSNDYI
tara:strand:+ start:1104 stop:1580 length:477 start_codon:yes stop_codon:yes gene_type:complete